MTKSLPSLRESIQADVLANTNKPRFCYMGYAPPLCIGDDFVDKPGRQSCIESCSQTPPLRVPYPKRGTGPDACFSTSPPLCVGDVFEPKQKRKELPEGQPVFKPAGRGKDPPILPHIDSPPITFSSSTTLKPESKFFVVPTRSGFFSPSIDYMSSETVAVAEKLNRVSVPFRATGNSGKLFQDYFDRSAQIVGPPVDLSHNRVVAKGKGEDIKTQPIPFKPGGLAGIVHSFPGYIPPTLIEPSKTTEKKKTNTWRSASVPLFSSPTSSISMNPINLNRRV